MPDPEPIITFAPIYPDDADARFVPAADDAGIFTNYDIQSCYEQDLRKGMMGISSPGGFSGGAAAFVQFAATTGLLIVQWTATKTGTQPEVPSPSLASQDWELLLKTMEPVMIALAADGTTPYYRLNGVYVFGKKNPSARLTDDVVFPRPPWIQDVFDRTMPANKLEGSLIDGKGQGGGNGPFPGDPGDIAMQ